MANATIAASDGYQDSYCSAAVHNIYITLESATPVPAYMIEGGSRPLKLGKVLWCTLLLMKEKGGTLLPATSYL